MRIFQRKNSLLAGFCLLASATSAQAAVFHINLNFTGLDATQQTYFSQAANFWDSVITGYDSKVTSSQISGVTISASVMATSDGVGGTLASGGPTSAWNVPGTGNYVLAKTGTMEFDSADIANMINNGTFTTVIEHEMAHVLGFGTLWTLNGLYTDGTGQYTGQYGLAAWKSEFSQPSATYVPVELGGGAGTADAHWNEVDGGSGNTGIVDTQGRDMKYELMTGWLNTPTFVSNTTIQSFRDLGYTVATVPLPAGIWFFGSALFSFIGWSAKKRQG